VRFRLVVFDFDGTLANTLPWFLGVSDRLADEFGFLRVDRSKLHELRSHDARTLLKLHRIPLWKVPTIARRFRDLMAAEIHQIAPFPGVPDLLERLAKGGSTVAIVTSNSPTNVRSVLGARVAAFIQHVEGGAAILGKWAKLRRVLRHSGVPADQAIFIGDEIRDAHSAHHAGIAFGAVSWGYTEIEALRAEAPDLVFASVADMAEKLGAR
jgi:phosphoglycolate phosphatase